MTPAELEFELLAWQYYHGKIAGPGKDWLKTQQERLEKITAQEAARVFNPEEEPVSPAEVFSTHG